MPSQSRGTRHPITTHARKGAARKALECAHHTASPGAMRRKRRKASWVRFSGVGHAKRYRKDEAKAATSCRGLYEKGFGDLSAWL